MPTLADRIEAAYRALEGCETAYGARAWFARQAKVHPWTVTRWIAGSPEIAGPPLAVLELLERQAGIEATETSALPE